MLDTSRNYYEVEDILRTIGAMCENKLNIFHCHITDAQSFPFVLPSEPDLVAKGSHGSGMQYSPADISRIVYHGLQHGVRVLLEIDARGNDQPPFLDQGNGGSWCGPFKTWPIVYNYDIAYNLTGEAKLVLGGGVARWSEQADPQVQDARIWPRASALAENLWSGNRDETGMKRYAQATYRQNEWRNRMVRKGIRAEPIQPLWCIKHPGMCIL